MIGILVVFAMIYKEMKFMASDGFYWNVDFGALRFDESLEVSVNGFGYDDALLVRLDDYPPIQVDQEDR